MAFIGIHACMCVCIPYPCAASEGAEFLSCQFHLIREMASPGNISGSESAREREPCGDLWPFSPLFFSPRDTRHIVRSGSASGSFAISVALICSHGVDLLSFFFRSEFHERTF